MSEQLADDRQAERRARAEAREGMPQVMQPDACETRGAANRGPGLLEVGARRAMPRAGNHMRVSLDTRQARQHGLRSRGKIDRLFARPRLQQMSLPGTSLGQRPAGSLWFHEHDLDLPVKNKDGETVKARCHNSP